MNQIFFIFRLLFVCFLVVFLIGGCALVGMQAIGLIVGSGTVITSAKEMLAPWVFGAATLCAVTAFVLGYRPETRAAKRAHNERETELENELRNIDSEE